MNRRTLLKCAGGLSVGGMFLTEKAIAGPTAAPKGPIVLYCDLAVDSAREQEMLDHFHREFKPAAQKYDGYIDVKMLKIRKVVDGGPPPAPGINYRFQLTYESEEKRQKWIHSDIHQHVWPLVEQTVLNRGYLTLLTDSV
jgi:hypothetical protein